MLLVSIQTYAQSSFQVLNGNETSRKSTYPVEFAFFTDVNADRIDAVIHYPTGDCYSILVKVIGADGIQGDYANRDFNSKCLPNRIIRITSNANLITYEAIEIDRRSESGLAIKPRATGVIARSTESPSLKKVMEDISALKNQIAEIKNSAPKFTIATFPEVFYKNTARCDPYTNLFNCECVKTVANLKSCKIDKKGLEEFFEVKFDHYLRQQRSNPAVTSNIELSKACFVYHGAKGLFESDSFVDSTALKMIDLGNLVINSATRINGRGRNGPCTQIVSGNTYPDPYEIYSDYITEWENNPNFSAVSITKFRQDFSSLYKGWLTILAPFQNIDVLGLSIGMDIEDVHKKMPFNELKVVLDSPHRLETPAPINRPPSLSHPTFDEKLWRESEKPHFKYIAALDEQTIQQNKTFRNTYFAKSDSMKQDYANAFRLLADVFDKPYNISYKGDYFKESKYSTFSELQIKEVKLSFNQFQQLSDITVVRKLEGLVSLDALKARFEDKYQHLDLKVEKSIGSIQLSLYNDNGHVAFRVNHRTGEHPYTLVTYTIDTFIGNAKSDLRTLYLQPIIDSLTSEYIQKNKLKNADAITI
jgi:hypothetical protein